VPFIVWMMAGLIPWLFIRPTILDGSNSVFKWINVVAQPVQCLLSRLLQIYLVNFVMMSVYVAFLASGVYPWIQYISYLICMIVHSLRLALFRKMKCRTIMAMQRTRQRNASSQTTSKSLLHLKTHLFERIKIQSGS